MKHLRKLHLIYWKISKPRTQGVRALLVKNDKILLVKHSYIDGWYLPGGGISKDEDPEQALKRELREELGTEISNPKFLGKYYNEYEGKRDTIFCYICTKFEPENKDKKEITKINSFPLKKLPNNISPGSKKRINEYLEGAKNLDRFW